MPNDQKPRPADAVTWIKHPDFPQSMESKRVRNERATRRQEAIEFVFRLLRPRPAPDLLHPTDTKGG
jgi:hypothetical protein